MLTKLYEKWHKLCGYIRLMIMFGKKSEFKQIHPELITLWKYKFWQMVRYSSKRTWTIVEEFLSVRITKESSCDLKANDKRKPILICTVKNDLAKLKHFMVHYRKLGIEDFVFLDNFSTDGSYEFLLEQPDTIVYRCEHAFTADRKIAWVNRLIAECGINRWYLLVDSDEFFGYLGSVKHPIETFIACIEKQGIKRVGVIHLDMYPKGKLFQADGEDNFIMKYSYFDKDTYDFETAKSGIRIVGGPRKRVFGTNMKISGERLVYFEKDDVIPSAHFMIPFKKTGEIPVYLVSRHYKFVNESDYQKLLEAVSTGMHSNNSEEYKTYYAILKEQPEISLYDEEHSLIFSEENIKQIKFLKDAFHEDI